MTIKELREFINKIPEEFDDYTLVSSTNDENPTEFDQVTEMDYSTFSIRGFNEKYCCVNMYRNE